MKTKKTLFSIFLTGMTVFTALPVAAFDDASDVDHPRYFFTREDLPTLRERTQQGLGAEIMDTVRTFADRYMEVSTEPYAHDTAYTGRNLQSYVGVLAFTGWIDSDIQRMEKAKEILLAAVRSYSLEDYMSWNGHLATGDACLGLALGYDWLAPFMTEEERAEVLDEIRILGDALVQKSLEKPTRGPMTPVGSMAHSRLLHNHGAVYHSGLYFAGLLTGQQNWVNHALLRIRGYFFYFQDGTGAPLEGIGYANYGLTSAALVNEANLSVGGRDMTRGVTGLRGFLRYILHNTVPMGREIAPINQTGHTFLDQVGPYYLANHLQDGLGLYAWRKLILKDGSFGIVSEPHTSHLKMLPFLLIWMDDDLEPISPVEAGEPTFANYHRGMTTARGSWTNPDSAFLTFQCARRSLGGWDHSDENSFTFTAFGQNLLLDPAAPFRNGDHHGVVLINGKSQLPGGGGQFVEGFPLAAEDRGESYYMAGDAASAYRNSAMLQEIGLPIESAIRRILFVPDAPSPFMIVADDIILDDGDSQNQFIWRGIYADRFTPNTLAIAEEGQSALIRSGDDGPVSRITFLEPSGLRLISSTVAEPIGQKTVSALDAVSPGMAEGHFLAVITAAESEDALPIIVRESTTDGVRVTVIHFNGDVDTALVTPDDIWLVDGN